MHVGDSRVAHAAGGPAAVQVDSRSHGPLVQIGSAPRRLRRQADHRHGRHIPIHDHTNVGRAADRHVRQRRVALDPFFNHRAVGTTAQRIQSCQDGRQMILHVGRRNIDGLRR